MIPKRKFLTLVLWALVIPLVAAQEQEQSTVVYDSAYFAQYNPVSLEDMFSNIPGGDSIIRGGGSRGGGNNTRGFGSSDVQVLIDGRRMSGKSNDMSTTLARIQASQVERIELIRGNAEGLDIRNEGIIYNVILRADASDSSSNFLDLGVTYLDAMSLQPDVLASYNGKRGQLEYGISYEHDTRPRVIRVDEDVLAPDRIPLEFRSQVTERETSENTFTANLGYEFNNGAQLRLNALYSDGEETEDRLEDRLLVNPGGSLTPSAVEDGIFLKDEQEFEVGGDLEFDVWQIGRLKTLFVLNRTENKDEIFQDLITNGMTNRLFSSFADFDEGETIVRSTMTSNFGRHTMEYGGEAAYNTLDRTFAFNGNPLENAIVEEDRYEIFVTHSTSLWEKFKLQSALTGEFSTIFQNRDGQTNSRSFEFLKPRVELRYDMTPSDQFRLLAKRTVSQLNLNNFVASRNVADDTINFGNPNLKPQSTWSFSLGYERRFADDGGSIEMRLVHERISDHIDKILIGTDDSGTGNIGSARKWAFETDFNVRFGFIGFPTAVLAVSYTYEDSETTDPFTREKRILRNSTPHYIRVNYRHDVENTDFAYGLSAHRRSFRSRQDISLVEETEFVIHFSVFAEYNITPRMKARFEASHMNHDARTFDKMFYNGNIADGNVSRIDFQDFKVDRDFTLSLQATF